MSSQPASFESLINHDHPIGVVGLGYVGLPLACLLGKKFKVLGFDIKSQRVSELRDGIDRTNEITERNSLLNPNISFSDDPSELSTCPVIIVAVPTPIDESKNPDLGPLESASKLVGSHMAKGTFIIFESTVYPGITEDVCGAILANASGLNPQDDFFLGYSPERVNPGDREHTIDKITKVISANSPECLDLIDEIYSSVITAGTFRAKSIRTAEAAKVIENTQRDINIGLINELAIIFDKIGLDTQDVLDAAGTKWNFLPFKPGLVGGHCIGVDPYYLTYLAESKGIDPQVILSGRRINDGMSLFVAKKTIALIAEKTPKNPSSRVTILGATFKENVPDTRNTKVIDLCRHLEDAGIQVQLCDPLADAEEFAEEYGRSLTKWEALEPCDAIILAVKHDEYVTKLSLENLCEQMRGEPLLLDLKNTIDRHEADKLGVRLWRL